MLIEVTVSLIAYIPAARNETGIISLDSKTLNGHADQGVLLQMLSQSRSLRCTVSQHAFSQDVSLILVMTTPNNEKDRLVQPNTGNWVY